MHRQHHQIDDEQQHHRYFQNQHPPIIPLGGQQLIQIIQCFQLLVDRVVPVRQMEARGKRLVDAG